MNGLLLLRRPACARHLPIQASHIRRHASSLIHQHGSLSEHELAPRFSIPDQPARTRFGPSPTGYLHLGSLRTALFNYLLARASGGQFILRIEDTDQSRLVPDAEKRICKDLKWAGLDWAEGPDIGGSFGPYRQSERLDIYRKYVDILLQKGRAFRCFCTKEQLGRLQEENGASAVAAHYPGTCLELSRSVSDRRAKNGEPHVIRFKSSESPVAVSDLIYGGYKKAEREDKFVLMKTDGFPTYHFANVVDDHLMAITHVIRGAEWLISTPKHVELYKAFGWRPPKFAHVGLLVDQQRQKLSKRDFQNIGISSYREKGILPTALLNFAVLLGWNPNLQAHPDLDQKGLLSLEEMEKNFSLKFTRGDIVVDMTKLKYYQKKYTASLIQEEPTDSPVLVANLIKPILEAVGKISQEISLDQKKDETPGSSTLEAFGNEELDGESAEGFNISVDEKRPVTTANDYKHIHQALKMWNGPVEDPETFVRNNRYLFWAVSKPAYRQSYRELAFYFADKVVSFQRTRLEEKPIRKVILTMRNALGRLPRKDWTQEKLDIIVKNLVGRVQCIHTNNEEEVVGAGWKLLRWALLNEMPGTQLVPLMVLLGQAETIRRMRLARKVAAAQDSKEKFEVNKKIRRERKLKRKALEIQKRKEEGKSVFTKYYTLTRDEESPAAKLKGPEHPMRSSPTNRLSDGDIPSPRHLPRPQKPGQVSYGSFSSEAKADSAHEIGVENSAYKDDRERPPRVSVTPDPLHKEHADKLHTRNFQSLVGKIGKKIW